MKKVSFFQKHLAYSVIATFGLIVAVALLSLYLIRPKEQQSRGITGPQQSYAFTLDLLLEKFPPQKAMDELVRNSDPRMLPDMLLLGSDFRIMASNTGATGWPGELPPIGDILPGDLYGFVPLGDRELGPMTPSLIRLKSSEPRYLVTYGQRGDPVRIVAPTLVGSLGLAAVFAFLLSFGFLAFYLRKQSILGQNVMSQIRSGNLKARIPIHRLDEIGRVMVQFNEMADEIERLILRVRDTERVRVNLLQDIGHDLRTPLASLRNMNETLVNHFARLSDAQKKELSEISVREIEYLSRLVDDLLLLARVDSPKYTQNDQSVDCVGILKKEIETVSAAQAGGGPGTIRVVLEGSAEGVWTRCNPQLIQRLFRNCIQNAASFATKQVSVSAGVSDGKLRVVVDDDGPGFPENALKTFGEKRPTRVFHEESGKRISLGLGSVIMKAIVTAHEGQLVASNRTEDGKTAGARVSIEFPIR